MRESAKNGTFERCLTAAKTIASYRHGRTGLEYRPSRRTQLAGLDDLPMSTDRLIGQRLEVRRKHEPDVMCLAQLIPLGVTRL